MHHSWLELPTDCDVANEERQMDVDEVKKNSLSARTIFSVITNLNFKSLRHKDPALIVLAFH